MILPAVRGTWVRQHLVVAIHSVLQRFHPHWAVCVGSCYCPGELTFSPQWQCEQCKRKTINVYYAEKNGAGVVFQNKARPSLGLGWAMRFTNYRLKVRKSIFHSNYWILHLFTLHLCDNCWHHLLSRKDFGNWETCHNINYYPQLLSLWRYCLTVNNINL